MLNTGRIVTGQSVALTTGYDDRLADRMNLFFLFFHITFY
jgi:hypothetical protein